MSYSRPHVNAQITVAELIEVLQKYPRDLPVVMYDPVGAEYIDIQQIDAEHKQLVIQAEE